MLELNIVIAGGQSAASRAAAAASATRTRAEKWRGSTKRLTGPSDVVADAVPEVALQRVIHRVACSCAHLAGAEAAAGLERRSCARQASLARCNTSQGRD